ncbi:MAG: hypothetical protein HFI53_12025 [Lachnospiraceae bacterium]|nr:hypothetical protein [Lachnospiraceae bacterium]
MEYIAHRINTIAELKKLPEEYGVELDLRDDLNGRIYISHNPFEAGEDFEAYCKEYRHGTMILNIKSERIEHEVLTLMEKYQIRDYFFLDSSFPMIKLLTDMGVKQVALRFSELEGLDTIRNMAGRARWVWVDCFTKIPIDRESFKELKALGYKLCFVSPELEGQEEKLAEYKEYIREQGIVFDAVCTKSYHIKDWM